MANKKKNKKHNEENEQVIEAEFVNVTAQEPETTDQEAPATEEDKKSIKIEFPYSELIRGQAPKTFELAEKVATDWMNDGEFKDLPIQQPLAQYFVGEGLRKAKDVEKKVTNKLNETGVSYIVKSQIEFLKSKLKK